MNNKEQSILTSTIREAIDLSDKQKRDSLSEFLDDQINDYIDTEIELNRLSHLGENRLNRNRLSKDKIDMINSLTLARDLASIPRVDVPERGALIQGRVSDKNFRGISDLAFTLQDSEGNTLGSVQPAKTDEVGFFSIPISAEVIPEFVGSEIFLVVRGNQKITRLPKPLAIKPDANILVEFSLSTGTVDRAGDSNSVVLKTEKRLADNGARGKESGEKKVKKKATARKKKPATKKK